MINNFFQNIEEIILYYIYFQKDQKFLDTLYIKIFQIILKIG